MSSTQEKIEEILVGLFQSGYIGSFEYGQVQLVEYRDKILNQAKKDIVALLVEAELKGFMVAFDCYDYERLREYKATLEGKLKTLQGKETTK